MNYYQNKFNYVKNKMSSAFNNKQNNNKLQNNNSN